MSLRLRLLALGSALLVTSAATVGAQERPYRPRAEAFRIKRPPYSYFKYRVPSFNNRLMPRIRLQQDDLRRRTLERSLELMGRARERQFDLQDRAWRRQLEGRERAMERVRERLDGNFRFRPFLYHRRVRTI